MTTELLAPAGGQEALVAAVQSGADAVYMGFGAFNARRSARNFSDEEFRAAVFYCHLRGAKVYLTLNTLVTDRELPALAAQARTASECGVDAILVQDWGVLATLQKIIPDVPLHASTQMSLHTLSGVQEAARLGMTRAVLARELSRGEIAEICQKSPIEIETFVHGALCMCYSGQCEMSAVIGRRSGNRGACAQPCRYHYALVEEQRPGEYFPIGEDEGGAYILNSRDMCMIDHIPELLGAGLNSLKIEGRAKSAYYAGIVTGAYRHAVDAAAAGKPLERVWRDEVEKVSHRPYSTGFYFGAPGQHTESARYVRDWQVMAVVTSCTPDGTALCSLRNKFSAGDELELVGPGVAPVAFRAQELTDGDGLPIDQARKPQMALHLKLPVQAPPLSVLRRKAVGL